MRVRAATVDDAERVAEVEVLSRRAAYRGLVPQARLDALQQGQRLPVWRTVLEQADGPRRVTLVVEDDAAVVGLADLRSTADDEAGAPGVGEIDSLYVLPGCWGRGCGSALMAAALQAFAAAGHAAAVLWVLETNERATGFYRRRGWRPDGAVEDLVADGVALRHVRYRYDLRRPDPPLVSRRA